MNRRILSHVNVLDMGTAVAGPYAATMLAELGANVIKVEVPGAGDLLRGSDTNVFGESGYFLGVNRGKRSVAVDLRTRDGQQIISNAVKRTDVLIQNFRPGRMEEWGLGYDDLRAQNERLIYCAISMYDETSDLRESTGNDIIGQAVSGLMDQTGERDGQPQRLGAPVVDVSAAYLATIAILGALMQREETGKGEHVRLSLLEAAYSLMPNYTVSLLNSDAIFERQGTSNALLAPYRAYETSEGGMLMVGAFNNGVWARLCGALGVPGMATDERYVTNVLRVENREALDAELQAILITGAAEHWQRLLTEHDVPATPILSPSRSLEQFRAAIPGLVRSFEGASGSEVLQLRSPFHFGTDIPDDVPTRLPAMGEHTAELLESLGYGEDDIRVLVDQGIV